MGRHRSRTDLTPLDATFTLFTPAQRRSLVVEPERTAGGNDHLQQSGRLWDSSEILPPGAGVELRQDVEVGVAIVFGRAVGREIHHLGLRIVGRKIAVLQDPYREQADRQDGHRSALVGGMQTIQQPLIQLWRIVVAADRAAELFKPVVDFVG